MQTNYNFSDVVFNGYNSLVANGFVTLSTYEEMQAVCNMAKDLGHGVMWNCPTATLYLVIPETTESITAETIHPELSNVTNEYQQLDLQMFADNDLISLISKALIKSGYTCEPTKENLIECFLDYVDAGTFSNLTCDEAKEDIEAGDITINQMCKALINL